MDPLTSIVTALAAGAAAALKSTVEQAVKDGYTTLKALIQCKYSQVNIEQLETNPGSKSRRGVVEEDLAATGADRIQRCYNTHRRCLRPFNAWHPRPLQPSAWN